MKAVVVVPTIREAHIKEWLCRWEKCFEEATIFVVEDNPERTFDLGKAPNVVHLSWEDIERDLGESAWIIPRRTDCIRSYGYLKAYQQQPDMIVTLDDDCYPMGDGFLGVHWHQLSSSAPVEAWVETTDGYATRGIPYFNRTRKWPCVLNHGLWVDNPDYDSPTQLVASRHPKEFVLRSQVIPAGNYFPMCGMNVAFRPEVTPAMYFLLMGQGYDYDRLGDIWAGVMVKKICDHLGFAVSSGGPTVVHEGASNVWDNLRKEAPGLEVNEIFWESVDDVVLSGSSFAECYVALAEALPLDGPYWSKLKRAMRVWAGLFLEDG